MLCRITLGCEVVGFVYLFVFVTLCMQVQDVVFHLLAQFFLFLGCFITTTLLAVGIILLFSLSAFLNYYLYPFQN